MSPEQMYKKPRALVGTFHGPSKTITVEPLRIRKTPSLPRREPSPVPKPPEREPPREPVPAR